MSGSDKTTATRRTSKPIVQLTLDNAKTAAIIQEMANRIAKQFNPLQVTLFGSFARGDQRPDSDIDLLVVLPEIENKHRAIMDIRRALADLAMAKDVVVTTPAEIKKRGELIGTILRPALREGKVLFRRRGWKLELGMNDGERLDDTRRWLRYASDDLRFGEATHRDSDTPPRYACFQAQQSAEKALKAILIFEQIDFPRTHNVADLMALVPDSWQAVRRLSDVATLTSWAVQARYPDALRDATDAEAASALEQARAVWDAVSSEFLARGINS